MLCSSLGHLRAQIATKRADVLKMHRGTVIGADSIVGESCTLDSATLASSIVGNHCVIGAGARLTNCLVFDYAQIHERAVLVNCVVGLRARVMRACTLTDCLIGGGFEVAESTTQKGVTLANDTD